MDVMEKLESLGKNSIELSIGFGEDGRYKKRGDADRRTGRSAGRFRMAHL